MIRVFARKAFGFKNYVKKENVTVAEVKAGVSIEARTRPLEFADLPDWVTNDPIFQWAQKDGDIQIIKNVQDEKITENKVADEENKDTANKTKK